MGFAERKIELFKIVADADEETTGKLIEFAQRLDQEKNEFSEEEIAEFDRRREEYLRHPDSAVPWEESMVRIRSKLIK